MKKFWQRYDTSLIAFVVFLIFALCTFFYDTFLALAELAALAVCVFIKSYYYKKKKQKLLFNVKNFSRLLDYENTNAFSTLTVPCCVVDEENEIVWCNDEFKKSFEIDESTPLLNLKQLLKRDNLDKVLAGRGFRIKCARKYFSVYSSFIEQEANGGITLLYFFDETKLRLTEKEYYDSRPSIMLCVLDNSDEIYQNFKESECAEIFSKIEQMIDDYVTEHGGLCRKFSSARSLIFIEEKGLQKMIQEKFSILDKIRNFKYEGKPCDLTLSIGVGKESNIYDSNNSAKQALDMAQSRGGDQVAIKHEVQYKFYGGVSEGFEKKNKVRTRLIAKTIAEIIKDSDNVVIMGHRFSDFDAVGSAIGMYTIAEHFGIKSNIVVNENTSLALPLITRFKHERKDVFVSTDKARSLMGQNTLLIVVDTHKGDFTECPQLVDMTDKIMVIDHHRKSVGFIEDTVVFYHMPNSSSASEMVTEIAEYVDAKPFMDRECALALFAGIMLDTRNFILRTGVRTFEAAAYLKGRSASTVEAKKLFSNDMDVFRMRNSVIDCAENYREVCAISCCELTSGSVHLATSQAADEMLNIDGIKASFVIYKNGDESDISARSYGEVNVQIIMEALGGGGHQAMAACQLKNTTIEQAKEKLKKAIDKYLDK